MAPGGSLWDWTKHAWSAMGGLIEDIYPPDDPDTAKRLGDLWIQGAEALETAISTSSGAGERVIQTWPDPNGFGMYRSIRAANRGEYGTGNGGYAELAANMRQMGENCHRYGEQVARAQNQIKSELIHAALDFATTFLIPGGPFLFATKMALRLAKLVKIFSSGTKLANLALKGGKIAMIPVKEALDEVATNGIEQGLNISQGYQDGFNVKESLTNGLAGAIGAPVSAVVGTPGALLGKGIRKTDTGRKLLDNPVGKHVSTAVSSASTNAVSSPISSHAADKMMNGQWDGLTDLSGYQQSIKDNWLTSAAIGPIRANAHLAGVQANQALYGGISNHMSPEVVAVEKPHDGGPPPPQAMAPEAAMAGAEGASTGSPQAAGAGHDAGAAHPGASASSGDTTSAETATGSGRDAFGGSETGGTTDTTASGRSVGTASEGHTSPADPASSRNDQGSSVRQTSVSSTQATSPPLDTGQATSAQGTSTTTAAQSGQASATTTATAQSGPTQSTAAQATTTQATTTQAAATQTTSAQNASTQPNPAQPGAPSKTPQAKPTEGEPNRSEPGTNPDQDGVTAPVDAPAEPASDVPVLPAEVPDDQKTAEPEDPGTPAEPSPALPAGPGLAAVRMAPRASGDPDEGGSASPSGERPARESEVPAEQASAEQDPADALVEAIWGGVPATRQAISELLAGLHPSQVAGTLDRICRVLGRSPAHPAPPRETPGGVPPEVTAAVADLPAGVHRAIAELAARVKPSALEPRLKGMAGGILPGDKARSFAQIVEAMDDAQRLAFEARLGQEVEKLAKAADSQTELASLQDLLPGKGGKGMLLEAADAQEILDRLKARGVDTSYAELELRAKMPNIRALLDGKQGLKKETLNDGDSENIRALLAALDAAASLADLPAPLLRELGLEGLKITGLQVPVDGEGRVGRDHQGKPKTDIDILGVLDDGTEVRIEVKDKTAFGLDSTSFTEVSTQISEQRRLAGDAVKVVALATFELSREVAEALVDAGADLVAQYHGFSVFVPVAERGDTSQGASSADPESTGPSPASAVVPGETQAGQEDPSAVRRAMEAENAGAISTRRRLLMGVLIATRLLGLPNTIDSALEVKPPKSGPVDLIRKRVEEEADPDTSPRPDPTPDEPDGSPWRGRARFNPGSGEVDVDMSPPAGPPGDPVGRQGPPVPPSSHAERFYHPDNPARHEHLLPQHTLTRSRLLLSLRSENALRALMAEAGMAWNDLRLVLLEHGLLPADSRPARVRDVRRILETLWVRTRIASALQETADAAAREFARLAEGLTPAESERARKIAEHVANGTMTPALRGIFVQQLFAEAVAAHEQEILGDHFGRFRLRTSPAYSLDGRGRAPAGPSHYSGWVVPNLTLDLVVDGQPVVAHEYDLNTGSRTPGRDRVHRGNTFTRGLFETETLRPADPATSSRARPRPAPRSPRDVPASPNEPGAIERAMEAANTPVLSYGRRILMGILLAVRLLGVPNTVDSLLELKPPKSGPSDVIRPRNTDEQGPRRRRPKGLPPRDPDGRFTTARIDPDTGEITFGDASGPASMGMSRHDEVGGSRWIDARRIVAPGPWDGAVITGEGVLYAPAGMAIGDDMTTRNAHMRVMIAQRPDGARAYVVTLHGSGNGHPIPGLSLMVDTHLTQEQMRAIEEIFMVSPEQVAEATLASPYYTPGRPVQLNSCHSGSSGWAQRYADALGAEVIAPMARLDVMRDGSLRVHGFPPGKGWARFIPGGSAPVEVPAPGNLPTAPGAESTGTPSSMDAVINPGRDETAEFLGREDVQDALRRGNEISGRDPDSRIKIDGVPTHIGDAIAQLLPRHPEFVKTLLETPFLLNSLLARPQTLGNVLQYPEAVATILESLEELSARGAEEILQEHRETPRPGPIETTETQRQAVADVLAGIPEQYHRAPPGQAGYAPPGRSTPEELQAYLDGLERSWRANQDELNELADWLAAEAGGIAKYRDKVKSRLRMMDKLGKDDGSGSVLTDVVGALVRFDTVADVYRALAILHARLASDGSPIDIVSLDDRFTGPQKSGYRDIQMSVRLSSGHIAEFRLHLKSIDEVARYEHSLYEVRRDFAAVSREQGRAVTPEETAVEALILRRERELFQEATNRGLTADDEREGS
ncbi:WXG100-like domain-containing protein [Amycolatopsis thailandensis]|uniref:WXG100-like domain-containing protein n=1 Tax=Amycolatopsis thailandensis TaxID=589330 RepID=UPI0036314E5D